MMRKFKLVARTVQYRPQKSPVVKDHYELEGCAGKEWAAVAEAWIHWEKGGQKFGWKTAWSSHYTDSSMFRLGKGEVRGESHDRVNAHREVIQVLEQVIGETVGFEKPHFSEDVKKATE